MTIGASIALIILGAILTFAVEVDVSGVNLAMIGIILMIGGGVGLVFGLVTSRRTRVVQEEPADEVVERRRRP